MHPLIVGIAHTPIAIQGLDEIVDRQFLVWGSGGSAPRLDVLDRGGADAGALRDRRMRLPFILGAPKACRDDDGEFR
jgi:hypothetical protein